MKMKMRVKEFYVKEFYEPVFKTNLIFIADAEPEQVERYIKKRFPNEDDISCRGFDGLAFRCDKDELKYYIIWMRDSEKYYTLTHECLHLVEWRFNDLGVKYESEQVCYYHEYWVKVLWREISRRGNGKTKKGKALP